jgi:hypothetical protein
MKSEIAKLGNVIRLTGAAANRRSRRHGGQTQRGRMR